MAARLPVLAYARDAEFFRQRIYKESRARDRWEPPKASDSLQHRFRRDIHDKRLVYTATLSHTRPFGTYVLDPVGPTPTLVGPRNDLARATLGTSSRPYTNPPLIMSKSFAEPPRMFRRYLEASTSSAARPYAPLLSWKP
jgi:hypothetical protein